MIFFSVMSTAHCNVFISLCCCLKSHCHLPYQCNMTYQNTSYIAMPYDKALHLGHPTAFWHSAEIWQGNAMNRGLDPEIAWHYSVFPHHTAFWHSTEICQGNAMDGVLDPEIAKHPMLVMNYTGNFKVWGLKIFGKFSYILPHEF